METLTRLVNEGCFDKYNRLVIWPEWLEYTTIRELVSNNLLTMVFLNNCYNHTDYYLNESAYMIASLRLQEGRSKIKIHNRIILS